MASLALENARSQLAEYEASLVLATALLTSSSNLNDSKNTKNNNKDISEGLGQVQDSLISITSLARGPSALSKISTSTATSLIPTISFDDAYPLLITADNNSGGKKKSGARGKVIVGQREATVKKLGLHSAVKRGCELVSEIRDIYCDFDVDVDVDVVGSSKKFKRKYKTPNQIRNSFLPPSLSGTSSIEQAFESFYDEVRTAKGYHARNHGTADPSTTVISGLGRVKTFGEVRFEGYDLSSKVREGILGAGGGVRRVEDIFSEEEVWGKYLDLGELHSHAMGVGLREVFVKGGGEGEGEGGVILR